MEVLEKKQYNSIGKQKNNTILGTDICSLYRMNYPQNIRKQKKKTSADPTSII